MVLAILSLISLTSAWVWEDGHFGPCPHINKLDTFDKSFFVGPFYQILRSSTLPLVLGDCQYSDYTDVNSTTVGTTMGFRINGVNYTANLFLNFATQAGLYGSFEVVVGPYLFHGNVVQTDFQNYFIVYVCDNYYQNRRDIFEFYSKNPNFDYTPYLQTAYDLGFSSDELFAPIQDATFCGR